MTNDQILEFIYNHGAEIGREMGFEKLRDYPHNDWIRHSVFGSDWQLKAHRGSFKTTAVDIVGASIRVILNPRQNFLVFRKTEDKIKEVINGIKKNFRTDIAKYIAKKVWNENLFLIEDSATKITTNLFDKPGGMSQLAGHGFKTPITSAHADVIYTDDITDLSDRLYKPERERTCLYYQELQNIRNPGGVLINTGTSWHRDDASKLMPAPEIVDYKNSGLLTEEDIKKLRLSMTASLFAANYELQYISDEAAIFKNPQHCDNDNEIFDGFGHIDCAYGGEDYTALTIIKKKTDGSYIGYGKIWHASVLKVIGAIAALCEKKRVGTVYLEDNGDKGLVARDLNALGVRATTYHESQNKDAKITTHGLKGWAKTKWTPDTDINYLEQICDYQEGIAPDDAPDSFASLCRKLTVQPTQIYY
jgi:hypothetical protein